MRSGRTPGVLADHTRLNTVTVVTRGCGNARFGELSAQGEGPAETLWQVHTGAGGKLAGGGGMHLEGEVPPYRAPCLCPATVSPTASGICNRH